MYLEDVSNWYTNADTANGDANADAPAAAAAADTTSLLFGLNLQLERWIYSSPTKTMTLVQWGKAQSPFFANLRDSDLSFRPFVRPSVRPFVHPSFRSSVRPFIRWSVRLVGRYFGIYIG